MIPACPFAAALKTQSKYISNSKQGAFKMLIILILNFKPFGYNYKNWSYLISMTMNLFNKVIFNIIATSPKGLIFLIFLKNQLI